MSRIAEKIEALKSGLSQARGAYSAELEKNSTLQSANAELLKANDALQLDANALRLQLDTAKQDLATAAAAQPDAVDVAAIESVDPFLAQS